MKIGIRIEGTPADRKAHVMSLLHDILHHLLDEVDRLDHSSEWPSQCVGGRHGYYLGGQVKADHTFEERVAQLRKKLIK